MRPHAPRTRRYPIVVGKLRLNGEMSLPATRQPLMFDRESHFQKTGTDGRNVERAIRYHGHIGLSGHKRELLIIKQAYDIGLFPAVPMLVSYDLPVRTEYWKNLADKGNYLVYIVYYHPTMKLTGRGEAFRKAYQEQFKEEPVYGAFNGYTQVVLLADALNAAKSDNGADLVKALLSNKFEGWNGTISFTRGEGPYWQQWSPPSCLRNTPGLSSHLPT